MDTTKLLTIMLMLIPGFAEAIIGYDCGSSRTNITTISTPKVGNCDLPFTKPDIKRLEFQLLQLVDYSEVEILQCKIEIDRTIYYCGNAFTHLSCD